MSDFAEKFKKALSENHLTHAKFAGAYGIPLKTVHAWAQGYREPPEWLQAILIDMIKRMVGEPQ